MGEEEFLVISECKVVECALRIAVDDRPGAFPIRMDGESCGEASRAVNDRAKCQEECDCGEAYPGEGESWGRELINGSTRQRVCGQSHHPLADRDQNSRERNMVVVFEERNIAKDNHC